jgi:hypothetical protein
MLQRVSGIAHIVQQHVAACMIRGFGLGARIACGLRMWVAGLVRMMLSQGVICGWREMTVECNRKVTVTCGT